MTRPLPQQFAPLVVAGTARHETDRNISVQCSNAVERSRTVETGHTDVEENNRDLVAVIAATIKSFLAAGCGPHLEARVLEKYLQNIANRILVIDNENGTTSVIVGELLTICLSMKYGRHP